MWRGLAEQGTAKSIPPIPKMDNAAPSVATGDNVREIVQQAIQNAKQAGRDAKIAGSDAKTAAQDAANAARQGPRGIATTAPPDYTGPDDIPPQVMKTIEMTFTLIGVLVLGMGVLRLVGKRMDRRTQVLASAGPDVTPQLRQLQESVDTMAIEIERISEGQRFTSKLMAERVAARPMLEGEKRS